MKMNKKLARIPYSELPNILAFTKATRCINFKNVRLFIKQTERNDSVLNPAVKFVFNIGFDGLLKKRKKQFFVNISRFLIKVSAFYTRNAWRLSF